MTANSERGRDPFRIWRAIAFTGFGFFILAGPAFHGCSDTVFREWAMYSGYGIGLCDLQLSELRPDGTRHRVDWLESLGYSPFTKAPLSVRRLDQVDEALEVAQRVRERLGRETELRVDLRIAYPDGWKWILVDEPLPEAGGTP